MIFKWLAERRRRKEEKRRQELFAEPGYASSDRAADDAREKLLEGADITFLTLPDGTKLPWRIK